jgi:2-polyprenylphenol 6-hydroxylase
MSGDVHDCVIVGGGAVGAATALGLARAGRRVALVERNARPVFNPETPVTRVTTLNAASMNLLEDLGVRPAIMSRRAHAFHGMEVWDAHSAARIRFDADDLGVPALGWTVELLALETSLWEALEAAGVDLFPGTGWRAVDWRSDRVDLHLDGGGRLSGRLLLAADGGESRLRQQAGIGVRRNPYRMSGVVATVRTRFPHEDTAWQRFNEEEIVAFLPLADGRSSIVWSMPDYAAGEVLALDDAEFSERLDQSFGGRLGGITAVEPRFVFPLVGRQANDYVRGRLVLLGDAAHTIHPLAGQGLNLGFGDVRALLDVLPEGAGSDPADPRSLRAYTRARRVENEIMLRSMEGLRWLFGSRGAVAMRTRAVGVQQVDRTPWIKRFLALRALGLS